MKLPARHLLLLFLLMVFAQPRGHAEEDGGDEMYISLLDIDHLSPEDQRELVTGYVRYLLMEPGCPKSILAPMGLMNEWRTTVLV